MRRPRARSRRGIMPSTPIIFRSIDGRCGRTCTLLGVLPGHAHPHQITSRAGRAVDAAIGKKRPVWALGLAGAPHLTGIAPKPGRLGPGARVGRAMARHHSLGPPSARRTPRTFSGRPFAGARSRSQRACGQRGPRLYERGQPRESRGSRLPPLPSHCRSRPWLSGGAPPRSSGVWPRHTGPL